MTLLQQGGWTRWPTEVPSNPYYSVILCDSVILWIGNFKITMESWQGTCRRKAHSVKLRFNLKSRWLLHKLKCSHLYILLCLVLCIRTFSNVWIAVARSLLRGKLINRMVLLVKFIKKLHRTPQILQLLATIRHFCFLLWFCSFPSLHYLILYLREEGKVNSEQKSWFACYYLKLSFLPANVFDTSYVFWQIALCKKTGR